MSAIQLSSYERMRRYLSDDDGTARTASMGLKRELVNWISTVSRSIERYLNRELLIAVYTEFFNPEFNQIEFWVAASPIVSLTSVYFDASGEWDGSESELTGAYAGLNNESVVVPVSIPALPKSIRAVYNGGLSSHGTRSTIAITTSSGTFAAGNFIVGQSSEAMGLIISATPTLLVYESLFGAFTVGETFKQYTDEEAATSSTATGVLVSFTIQSCAELFPDLVRACEAQVRFMWKHKHDLESTSIQLTEKT